MVLINPRHIELEKRFQHFVKQGTSIAQESPKESQELTGFRIVLFHQILWRRRKEFALIMQKFLNNSIQMEEFETEFSLLYWKLDIVINIARSDVIKANRSIESWF